MFTPTDPYRRELLDELVLKSVATMQDVERVAAFNGAIHDRGVATMTRELILNHPHTRPEQWLYVEDEASNQIVSSLCLIPWTWRYEGVQIRAGEAGIIGTLEPYRRRGLVRAQFARHAELLREGDYDLSPIQGIPYFYRQFGYEYALPLEGGHRIELHQIPDPPTDPGPRTTYRQATLDDVPVLMRHYAQAASDLAIHTARDEGEWRYLLGPSMGTEMVAETWIVLDVENSTIGYFRVPQHGFGEGLIVNEVSHLDAASALSVLQQLKRWSQERGKPYIRLCLPAHHTMVQVARYRGAHDPGHYAWQIKLVDVARFLKKIAPVLERRVAGSPYAGMTKNVLLNLYRRAYELRFEDGALTAVEALGFSDRGGIRIPPPLFAPLVLGYRSREELSRAHHDVSIGGEWQHIVDVLFPQMTSFIYTVY